MDRSRFLKAIFVVCLLLVSAASATERKDPPAKPVDAPAGQSGFLTVIVNGRALSGPNSLARIGGGSVLVPVSAIAHSLGDSVNINIAARLVSITRQDGVSAEFDATLGQVRENGAITLTVSNSGGIIFPANAAEMMLPVEIAASLLDASIRLDATQNKVIVLRGIAASGVVTREQERGFGEIYRAEYDYNLSDHSGSIAHNLIITAAGRLFDGRFYLNSNSSGSSFRQFTPRNFSFNLERPNGQRFIAGDFGSGAELPLLTANVRGGLVSVPIGNFTVAAFGGRADSGTAMPIVFGSDPAFSPFIRRQRFDTNVLGGYFSTGVLAGASPLKVSAGAMRFSGRSRSGTIASSSAVYAGTRMRIQADLGLGNFEGFDSQQRRVNGAGMAVDLTGSFQVAEDLSFHGRYAQISKDFLSPQSGIREPLDLKAAGVSWSPAKWLSATFNASTLRRPGTAGRADSYVSAAFGINPGAGKPRFYLSHTQNSSPAVRSGSFTTLNAVHDLRRLRLFVNAARIKSLGPAITSAQFGANLIVNDTNSLEMSQGLGSGGRLNGMVDWRTSGLLKGRLSLSAGGGYNYSRGGQISSFERVTASLGLPRRSSLQVSFMNTTAGPTLLVQLRGTLFKKREAGAYINSPISETLNLSSVSGRVYQDVDGDGRFDPTIDKPQSGVKVRLDGNRLVESGPDGIYRFDAVTVGRHRLYLDLLSVRADLTILDEASRDLTLEGGNDTFLDFRLARTGRISGRVWMDTNGNGVLDEGELPLADVRVVTSSGRDTLTGSEGLFTISDLSPGEHLVFIDERTLPEKFTPRSRSITARVFPGRETSDVFVPAIPLPAEVKRFPARTAQ